MCKCDGVVKSPIYFFVSFCQTCDHTYAMSQVWQKYYALYIEIFDLAILDCCPTFYGNIIFTWRNYTNCILQQVNLCRVASLNRLPFFFIITTCLILPVFSFAGQNSPKALIRRANNLVQTGGYINTSQGIITAQLNPDQKFIPASVLKIITSAAAWHILGKNYRFTTSFFQNKQGDLFIKGNGDPFLTSEEISTIAKQLVASGLKPFSQIVIDHSAYSLDKKTRINGRSTNPYDAEISALSVNFNTLNIAVSTNGEISSAETQTPNLPIMLQYGKNLPPGKHRLALNDRPQTITRYAGQLITALLAKAFHQGQQIPVPSDAVEISTGLIPMDLRPIYVHTSSKKLPEIIKPMLRYSNNLIANHLFLTCGAVQFGYPATWKKGQKAIRFFLENDIGIKNNNYKIVEGSGLSRLNQISSGAVIKVLDYFKLNMNLLHKRRGAFLKSGTLSGVYAYAGYWPNSDPFVLILNQKNNTRKPLLKLLKRQHNVTLSQKYIQKTTTSR